MNPLSADGAGYFYDQTTVIWADSAGAYDAELDLGNGQTFTYEGLYLLGAATNTSGFAPIDSPTFTGVPQAPTPASNDSSGKIATTAFVTAQGFATLNSPALTGTPTAPTPTTGDDDTSIATTAFVQDALLPANLASSFAQALAADGYITLPGGLMIQWGTHSPGDDSYTLYNLPTPFLTVFYGVVAVVKYNVAKTGGNGGGAIAYPASLTQVGLGIAWNGDSTGITDVFYMAVGK